MNLTTHHAMPSLGLKMDAAVTLLHPYAFMAWTGAILPLHFPPIEWVLRILFSKGKQPKPGTGH